MPVLGADVAALQAQRSSSSGRSFASPSYVYDSAAERAADDAGVRLVSIPDAYATRAGGGVSNPVPDRLARVVDADFIDSPTIGGPGGGDVFVTAADDIAGMSSAEIGQRLTLFDAAGKPRTGPFAVLEFDTPASGLASPINRTNPGFVQGGRTVGGAREFVLPNMSTDELLNLIRRQAG